MKTIPVLTHLKRYQALLEIEEMGEVAAVNALIKLWGYEHLFLPNRSLNERIHFEIDLLQEQILEESLERWLQTAGGVAAWEQAHLGILRFLDVTALFGVSEELLIKDITFEKLHSVILQRRTKELNEGAE